MGGAGGYCRGLRGVKGPEVTEDKVRLAVREEEVVSEGN